MAGVAAATDRSGDGRRWHDRHERRRAAGVARRARPRPRPRPRPSRRPSTTATAGSTSGRPAARTTTRGRRWTATGTLTLDGRRSTVDGAAWFDHQWGDFISVGGGGWDWFAVNLDDGTDLTLSLVRDADGTYPLVYGTLVAPDGTVRHLDRDAFTRRRDRPLDQPDDRRRLPGRLDDPDPGRRPDDRPARRRSPTRSSTRGRRPGVIYWEGSQGVRATRGGVPLGGEAYVELTGYAASVTPRAVGTDAPGRRGAVKRGSGRRRRQRRQLRSTVAAKARAAASTSPIELMTVSIRVAVSW